MCHQLPCVLDTVSIWSATELLLYVNGQLLATTPLNQIDETIGFAQGGFELGGVWSPLWVAGPSDIDVAALRIWPYQTLTSLQVRSLAAGEPITSLGNTTSVGWKAANGEWQPWTFNNSNTASQSLQSLATISPISSLSSFVNMTSKDATCSSTINDDDDGWKYGVGLGVGFGGMLCLVLIGYRVARRNHVHKQQNGDVDAVPPAAAVDPNFGGFFNLPRPQQPHQAAQHSVVVSPPIAAAPVPPDAASIHPVATPSIAMVMIQPQPHHGEHASVSPFATPVIINNNGHQYDAVIYPAANGILNNNDGINGGNVNGGAIVIVNARAEGQPAVQPSPYLRYAVPMPLGPLPLHDMGGVDGIGGDQLVDGDMMANHGHHDNNIVRLHHQYDAPDAEPVG
jgi:hypothetical protein